VIVGFDMAVSAETSLPNSNIQLLTIPIRKLNALIELYDSTNTSLLEFKRTSGAVLRSRTVPDIPLKPISILPGTLHQFKIRIDKAGEFNFSSSEIDSDNIDDRIYLPGSLSNDRKVSQSFSPGQGMEFIDGIWLIQHYLMALNRRIKNKTEGKEHIMIPLSLFTAIKAIEHIFGNDGDQAMNEFNESLNEFKNWLKERIESMYNQFKELESYIATSNKVNSDFKSPDVEFNEQLVENFFRFDEESWNSQKSSFTYSAYLCSKNLPNEHNREVVLELIKNALIDLFLPSDKWISKTAQMETSHPDEKLTLRVEKGEFGKKYKAVKKTLVPVKKALESDRGKKPNVDYIAAIAECDAILEACDSELSVNSLVVNSHFSLKHKIEMIIKKYSLTTIMEDDIEQNFKGLYDALSKIYEGKIPPTTLDNTFVELTSIKYNFDKCSDIMDSAKELIRNSSTSRDSEIIRSAADKKFSELKKDIVGLRSKLKTISELEETSKEKLIACEEALDELESQLTEGDADESVLWIGLGQAGGQILRECALYCLSNLSDARCTALLTALGVNTDDLKNVQSWTKDTHSSEPLKKKTAEENLMKLFDKKVHLLAINLGEEVDDLAKDNEPGYFLWGSDVPYDKTSRTIRTKKNILKLKPGGEGAGGSTGVGRAFGFRYKTDISDVMKDVGKKGNSKPKHIVITHSLAGGSGSGMVLPVLQQARKTFGPEPIIWVISVGEGASEQRNVAMVNTPFIISDILQANYAGIHAIHDPIELKEWRGFSKEISEESERMDKALVNFIKMINPDLTTNGKPLVENLNSDSLFAGGHVNKYSAEVMEWVDSYKRIKDLNFQIKDDESPINFMKLLEVDNSIFGQKKHNELAKNLIEVLPNTVEQASSFTAWCQKQEQGGKRPAAIFWMNWIKCQFDPLSLFIEGRDKDKQTIADENGDSTEQYFVPDLTSSHLKSAINRIYHDNGIKAPNGKIPEYQNLAFGMAPLVRVIENHIISMTDEKSKVALDKIKEIFDDYGGGLNKFNSIKEKMTIHILSLSGVGSDPLIKSIIVSNAHLEKGVNSTSQLDPSGKAYTVYNSVIFDLMLNIIGPRLPTESGVFIPMDEKFDHMDLVGSTKPPLVIGLLNQRDSISLTEPPAVLSTGIEPAELGAMLNSMFTQEFVNIEGATPLKNPLFLAKMGMSEKIQALFQSIFGSRFKYMLQINPYDVMEHTSLDESKFSDFCDELIEIWDDDGGDMFSVSDAQRKNLSMNHGIAGLHIANLVRWFSLIDPITFSRFTANKSQVGEYVQYLDRDDTLWKLVGKDETFDIGVLRIDPTIQRYVGKGNSINQKNLYAALPKLGIKNAEILRSVAPAYLNSFLPIELLFTCKEVKIGELDFSNDGISRKDFFGELDVDSYDGFMEMALKILQDGHSLETSGLLSGSEMDETMDDWFVEINCILNSIDLRIVKDIDQYYLRLHPRLNRYFSAVRDIPIRPTDKLLPSRSAPASLSRYIHSDSLEKPLDRHYSATKRTGIASPTFTFGGQIMNQMRNISLLPDDRKLSLIPMLRLLLLSAGNAAEFQKRLTSQFQNIGMDAQSLETHFTRILDDNVYTRLELYSEPDIYGDQVSTLINRLHDCKELFEDLIKELPKGWNNHDLSGLKFLLWIIDQEDITFGNKEDATNIFRSNIESIPKIREWLQDLIAIIVNGTYSSQDSSTEETLSEEYVKETVSDENSTIVGIKQLFYDISYLLNEALSQAEYLNKEHKFSRNVHFEMTGFSDRLIGKPKGLLLLIHDRNPKLPMDKIQESIRESITYSFGGKLGSPKAFSTAADFGPSSFLTVVLQNAPTADISDQFQSLINDPSEGLAGSNPSWSINESKLHPYILLYNLLWLSVNLPEWTHLDNKEYMRRFQIPTSIIQHHYSDPGKMDNDRIRLEKDKTAFEGDVSMPQDDKRDYTNAIKGELTGVRNILPLLGIMALRHEKAGEFGKEKIWQECGLSQEDYDLLKDLYRSVAEVIGKDHLFSEPKSGTGEKASRLGVFKKSKPKATIVAPDTLKDRTKAWFTAYVAWLGHKKTAEIQEETLSSGGEILFTASPDE
jgi:hypothetical protein